MNNIQINAQRRWGPPEDWSGPPPEHGTEVFIKNLPREVFETELGAIFSSAGTVYEVRLPVNWDGFNRGYAFLRFTSVREADEAIAKLDGYEIRRKRAIKVTRSIDNARLFLSGVPVDRNSEQLKTDLSHYVDNVKKVYVYPVLENRSVYRGYAFVEFETHRDAAIAKRILTSDTCYRIFEMKCVAAWASPLPFLDQSILKSLNILFMRNIPKEIKGFHLKLIIENYIGRDEVKHVKRMNDFAFLTFEDHKSAERALHRLQSIPCLIPDHETQLEWARPRALTESAQSGPRGKDSGEAFKNRLNSTGSDGGRGKRKPRGGGGGGGGSCVHRLEALKSAISIALGDASVDEHRRESSLPIPMTFPRDFGADGFDRAPQRKLTSSSLSSLSPPTSTTWSGESPTRTFLAPDDLLVFPPSQIRDLFPVSDMREPEAEANFGALATSKDSLWISNGNRK